MMNKVDPHIVKAMQLERERKKEERRRSERVWVEAKPLLDALQVAGLDPSDFGAFGWASFSTFDFERAAPILIEWLPRVSDRRVKEAMVRSLADQKAAKGEDTRRLITEFHRAEHADDASLKWAIGDTVATLALPEDADAVIDILRDPRHGRARQMFCDALVRTRDPRRVDVLIDLIEDDELAGHAIAALRQCAYRRRVPQPERVRPKLEALLKRGTSDMTGSGPGPFAMRQARNALKAIERTQAASS